MKREYPTLSELIPEIKPTLTLQQVVQLAWKYGVPPDDILYIMDLQFFLVDRMIWNKLNENNSCWVNSDLVYTPMEELTCSQQSTKLSVQSIKKSMLEALKTI